MTVSSLRYWSRGVGFVVPKRFARLVTLREKRESLRTELPFMPHRLRRNRNSANMLQRAYRSGYASADAKIPYGWAVLGYNADSVEKAFFAGYVANKQPKHTHHRTWSDDNWWRACAA